MRLKKKIEFILYLLYFFTVVSGISLVQFFNTTELMYLLIFAGALGASIIFGCFTGNGDDIIEIAKWEGEYLIFERSVSGTRYWNRTFKVHKNEVQIILLQVNEEYINELIIVTKNIYFYVTNTHNKDLIIGFFDNHFFLEADYENAKIRLASDNNNSIMLYKRNA